MNYFYENLMFSIGDREKFDIDLLKEYIPSCDKVEKTDIETDKTGTDYIATLKDGSSVTIDAKTRKKGAKQYWEYGEPELALERYSVVEKKIVGWLFKDSDVHPDYILYTFDKSDTDKFFFIPYILLRKACAENGQVWKAKYKLKTQPNFGYTSDALFVPASVVINAVRDCMEGKVK